MPFDRGFVLLAICLAAGSGGAALGAEPTRVVTVEGMTEYQLENGLKLLLYPDPSRPTVTINLTVFVGSRHEGYGEGGMAHLLEHMVFKGTPSHPNPPKALRDRGASFNGTTWVDRTNYFETLSANEENLEWAIRFEADRLVNSLVRAEDLASEMTVVRNEFERGENSPAALLNKRMMAAAYDWHNYGKSTIGNRADIERVPIENLRAFYRRYYQPDNCLLVVAGQFDEALAVALVQKYFGAIPRPQRRLEETYTEEPPQDGERFVRLERVGDVGLLGVLYHIPAGPHPDTAALQVLANVLTDVPSGRLYIALVEPKKASTVQANSAAWHDPGVFQVMAQVRRDDSLEEAREILLQTIDHVVRDGVAESEVDRARQRLLAARRQAAEDTTQLAVALSNWASQGDWRLYFLHRDRLEAVTAADVARVAGRYLIESNRTSGMYVPKAQPSLAAIPATPDVPALVSDYKGRAGVTAGEAFDFGYANVELRTRRLKHDSGVKMALLPKKSRDEAVLLSLSLRYGSAQSLRGLRAAAELLPDLLERGTQKLSFAQWRDALARLDTQIEASGSAGTLQLQVRSRRPHLSEVLELVRQMLREPALLPEELDVIKRQQVTLLERQRTEPLPLANNRLERALNPYPADDVRSIPDLNEEIEMVRAVSIDMLRTLHAEFLGSAAAELTIVGDFQIEALAPHLQAIFGGWKSAVPFERLERQAFLDVPGGRFALNTPDKANADYVAGLSIAMSDQHADYPALVLGNYIFGGGGSLTSRLGERVRQQEGLSYGVGSTLIASWEDQSATLTIRASCNPVNLPKLERVIAEELARLLERGIGEDELAKAKEAWLRGRAVSRASDRGIAPRLARSLRLDQTLEYDARLDERIGGLTAAQVVDALRKYVDPKRLVIVAAGDLAKISP
jgi:zinc protease